MIGVAAGEAAVRLARSAIELGLSAEPPSDPAEPFRSRSLPPAFDEHRGVFVTLTRFPNGTLRGCIGFPLPVYTLRAAIPRAAVAAAVEDPRFRPLDSTEVTEVVVEVSILSVPKPIRSNRPERRRDQVEVGRHGLIVSRGRASGLLLPQVAVEYSWSADEFLSETCRKAVLPPDAWLSAETRVDSFEAEVYGERTPAGPVERRVSVDRTIATEPAVAEPRK